VDQSLSPGRKRKAGQKPNPRPLFFLCLALMLLSLASFAVILVTIVVPYDKSAYTQAHGQPRSGIVTSVANHEGKSHTADVDVQLTQSVGGRATTTAHVPALVSLSPGATVQVLVDPQDPGYAEFPRQSYIFKSSAQVAVIVGLVCIAAFTSITVWSAWQWRRQHQALAQRKDRERGLANGA
jgi:hypothetical protein